MKRLLILFILFASCKTKNPSLENFDAQSWRNDVMACENNRASQLSTLLQQKQELLGMDSDEVISFLGKPDETALYTRNQKFFHYFTTPGPECDGYNEDKLSKLILRFNATGLVKEVSLYN